MFTSFRAELPSRPRVIIVVAEHRYISPEQELALELHNRAVPSVEAHHRVNGPDTGKIPEEGG